MNKTFTIWLISIAMILCMTPYCFSQDTDLEDSEEKDTSKKIESVKLEDTTVVGTRTEVDIAKYPGAVNVITEKDLKQSSSVIESLSIIPGFETGGGHGRNIGQQFTIRGFGYQSEQRVIIKQDGVRRSPGLFSNHISSFRSEPEILKRIEVVKGASSIAHGGGAIGGVVEMTTKDAFDYLKEGQNIGTKINYRYEDNNYQSASIALYGNPNQGRFDFLVYGRLGNTGDLELAEPTGDISRVQNNEDLLSKFIKLGFHPSDDQRLTLSFFNYTNKIEGAWQNVYNSEYSDDGPVTGDLNQMDIALGYSYKPAHNLINLDTSFFLSTSSYDRTADYTSMSLLVDYENEEKSWGVNLKNLFNFATGPIEHKLLIGFDYTKKEEDAFYQRNGVVTDFGSMPNSYSDMGLYIQNEIPFLDNRLILYLGGRQDWFERSVEGENADYSESRFSPRIGAALEVINGLTLLANYSEAFRAPTPHETSSNGPLNRHYWYLPASDLGPELAKETEFGFTYKRDDLMNNRVDAWFRALYFMGDIEDMISLRRLPALGASPAGTPYATYQNVSKVKREGFELESKFAFASFAFNASYEHLNQYDSSSKKKVPNGFADKLRAGVSYTYAPLNLMVGLNISHWLKPDQNPKYTVFRGTTYYKVDDDYTITNINVKWAPEKTGFDLLDNGFELLVGINNVFDKNYINSRGYSNTSRSGKGRNLFLNISKKF